ncbi:MAG: hypothetical protein WA782_07845 [Sulfitobacter sp.]
MAGPPGDWSQKKTPGRLTEGAKRNHVSTPVFLYLDTGGSSVFTWLGCWSLGGELSFAAFARALANLEEAAVHMAVELKNAAFDLMAADSPQQTIRIFAARARSTKNAASA